MFADMEREAKETDSLDSDESGSAPKSRNKGV